jgi:integrase
MPLGKYETPGLKRRQGSGRAVAVWVARADLVKAGYKPKTVRLPYDLDDPACWPLLSAACLKLQSEMLEWSSGRRRDPDRFDGTVCGLSRRYQTDQVSPFQRLKWNTREKDVYTLRIIEKAFGKRSLASLKYVDFRRWYDEAKKPKTPGGPERVRKACGIIKKLREMLSYGKLIELRECARLVLILREARFAQPARRRSRLELHHVEAFVPAAIAAGRHSLALATVIQFETVLRQRDVIGEWQPIADGERTTGIVLNGGRWVNGLTWADLAADRVLRKATTKTGAIVAHDLKLLPLVWPLLDMVPADRRIGPLIIDETQGRPYAGDAFQREWRKVARAAGIPNGIWNMDARAGGVSEADDAGAELDDIRAQTGHTNPAMTARYARGGLGKSRKVAAMRVAHRSQKNEP